MEFTACGFGTDQAMHFAICLHDCCALLASFYMVDILLTIELRNPLNSISVLEILIFVLKCFWRCLFLINSNHFVFCRPSTFLCPSSTRACHVCRCRPTKPTCHCLPFSSRSAMNFGPPSLPVCLLRRWPLPSTNGFLPLV